MPLIKTSGLFGGATKFVAKGLFGLGKGLTKKVALPAATGAVKGVATAAGAAGKFAVKHPQAAMTTAAAGMTTRDTLSKHFGQTWNLQRNMPYRYF